MSRPPSPVGTAPGTHVATPHLAATASAMLLIMVMALAASAVPVGAQPVRSADDLRWAQTRTIRADDDVRITLDDGVSRQGAFLTADDQSITITSGERDERLQRAQVREVWVARGTHRRRNILIGVGVALAAPALRSACTVVGKALHAVRLPRRTACRFWQRA